ncbi:MAG TPA: MFS transporter [Gemmatimonadaceae bacterium]|nr:MFS transporter [Gemmatimonadaceae bacterium]
MSRRHTDSGPVETDIPARLDRLSWSGFHTLVVVALGITWILDGLEVTVGGSIATALHESPVLHLSEAAIGAAATAYLLGNVVGALGFGWLTDQLGRKRLFTITLGLYLVATAATATAWNFPSYAFCRFLTGAGIGGEATAINSAIQELIPARYRGRTDLAINGSFWVGAALAAVASLVLLNPAILPPDLGWRAAFGLGAILGLGVLMLRRYVPESPRWLMVHGRLAEANRIVADIEARADAPPPDVALPTLRLSGTRHGGAGEVVRTLLTTYRQRTVLGVVLVAAQAFFYNAIFFTYALILGHFYGVPSAHIGWYLLLFAVGNFFGPLILGPFFDTIGRRPMIAATYAIAGLALAGAAQLFAHGLLDATTQTLAWTVIFFFASAAASSAYLTVSESFPLEIRALAIALFYALGTLLGGAAAPWIFGRLIQHGQRASLVVGYDVGAALMLIAAATELAIGVAAERRSLESVAAPLSRA